MSSMDMRLPILLKILSYHGKAAEPIEKRRSRIFLYNLDTVSALAKQEGKVTILNYASYKYPGGGFINGMMAQEEALCHASTLYPVLRTFDGSYYAENRAIRNRGLYKNEAIYSPNIVFPQNDGSTLVADVLTCAAPNWGAAIRNGVTLKENEAILRDRLKFINYILQEQEVNCFIAGAWGCGVFKQDPEFVCRAIYEEIMYPETLVLAVPAGRNYDAFDEVLKNG